MALLTGIAQLRGVEWGRSYLWDLLFPSGTGYAAPPSPFNKWFPAEDVSAPRGSVESIPFDTPMGSLKIPKSSPGTEDLRITFIDDSKRSLMGWMSEWIESITPMGYVATVSSAVRHIQVMQLSPKRAITKTYNYWVYPEGGIRFEGNSQSEVVKYQMTFNVVGSQG